MTLRIEGLGITLRPKAPIWKSAARQFWKTALVGLARAVNYRDEKSPTKAMTPTIAEG